MNPERMIELLDNLIPEEGIIEDIIEKVNLFRISTSSPRSPLTYEPGILILAQGQKKVFIGDDVFIYNPLNYLVISVPLPLECETTASAEKPLIGIKIKVDAKAVGEILLSLDSTQENKKFIPKGIYSAPLIIR